MQTAPFSTRFTAKKQSILSQLALDPKDYEDKSPKGSVDVQILDLLRLINDVDGWVTTSSCAGRVAVFVEGPKERDLQDPRPNDDFELGTAQSAQQGSATEAGNDATVMTAPGGKGGGHWLYVSHDPLPDSIGAEPHTDTWTQHFGLSRITATEVRSYTGTSQLVHLTYSPLILHILCASLEHARPLLAAAINAGFRESGVQSLKALDPSQVGDGVMVAIRTNGIVFESLVGLQDSDGVARAVVDEGYLAMCAGIINERFHWNEVRKARLVNELESVIKRAGWHGDAAKQETKEERRERKRRAGLKRQAQQAYLNGEGSVAQNNATQTAQPQSQTHNDIDLSVLDNT